MGQVGRRLSPSGRAYLNGMRPAPPKTVQIHLIGMRWSGCWVVEGRELVLMSAYGGTSRTLGRRKPERLAEELLREVLAQRAEEGCLTPKS